MLEYLKTPAGVRVVSVLCAIGLAAAVHKWPDMAQYLVPFLPIAATEVKRLNDTAPAPPAQESGQ